MNEKVSDFQLIYNSKIKWIYQKLINFKTSFKVKNQQYKIWITNWMKSKSKLKIYKVCVTTTYKIIKNKSMELWQ